MCFSAAEERHGGVLALPNRFLKTIVTKRYGDELARYAETVGLESVEIVVDPTVSSARRTFHLLRRRVRRYLRVSGSSVRG